MFKKYEILKILILLVLLYLSNKIMKLLLNINKNTHESYNGTFNITKDEERKKKLILLAKKITFKR